jgi:hypothetical protein
MIHATTTHVARAFSTRSPLDVCEIVEQLPDGTAGELLFRGTGATSEGALFVENRRVCWSAARGLARRLSDLLAAPAKLDAEHMESIYAACTRKRIPLGEYLVDAGLLTPSDLRSALLRHTTESLHALCGPGSSAEWVPRRSGGYNSQFTFSTTEVLARTLAESHQALAACAATELAEAFDGRDWGAAFVRSASRAGPEPIGVQGDFPDKIRVLLRLGQWASSSLDIKSLVQGDDTFVATVLDESALVAWRCGPAIIAGSTSLHGPARVLNRRARARRKGVLLGSL